MNNYQKHNISVEKKRDRFYITYLTAGLRFKRYNVELSKFSLIVDILLKYSGQNDNNSIKKQIVQVELYKNIFMTGKYLISVKKGDRDSFNYDIDSQYAAAFQGGENKKYYYDFYLLPLKVLQFYNCIQTDRYNIFMDYKNLNNFYTKKLRRI